MPLSKAMCLLHANNLFEEVVYRQVIKLACVRQGIL